MAWPWQEQSSWRQARLRERWFGRRPYGACQRQAAWQRDKFRCEALGNSLGSVVELNGKTKGAAGRTGPSRGPRDDRSEYLARAFQRLPHTPPDRNTDKAPTQPCPYV